MLFTLEWIKQIFPNQRGNIDNKLVIKKVNTDSRIATIDSLFIPIVGENFNGHDYVDQAIQGGAIAVMWDEQEPLPASIPSDFPVFFVKDTTKGLQDLAHYYRKKINPTVIGITGSNGKTTTKDLVASVVKTVYETHYTRGNLNNHIGLPLTILEMPHNTEVLVVEMGMSGFGEIDTLTKIAEPDYAIVTNIGESHIEFLGSREGIAKAKLEIRNGLQENGLLVIDGDEPLLQRLHTEDNVLTCGFQAGLSKEITEVDVTLKGTEFSLSNGKTFNLPLYGKHHAKNASFAIAIADKLNIPTEKQIIAFQSLDYTSMRFELLQGKNGAKIVNDSYNASPTSMIGAIDVVKQLAGFNEKVLVLGDVLELGNFAEGMHRSIAESIREPITNVYTYGENAFFISEEVNNKTNIPSKHYSSKEALVKDLNHHLQNDTVILFKASRGLQFESMVNELLEDIEKQER